MLARIFLVLTMVLGASVLGISASRAAPVSIVVIGDSNIEGKGVASSEAYPAQLERALRAKGIDARVVNAGKNGDTTFGVMARLDQSVPNGTTLAIISVGVNDVVLRHQSPEETRGRVQQIAQRLQARGIKTLVLQTGKNFQGEIADDPRYHVEGQAGRTGPAPGTTEWHLNAAGYAKVVQRTLPRVLAALRGK